MSATPIWHVIDAKGHVVGRVAQMVSRILMGKHKPVYLLFLSSLFLSFILNIICLCFPLLVFLYRFVRFFSFLVHQKLLHFKLLTLTLSNLSIDSHRYDSSVDAGDYVVVVNAKHAQFTGNKLENKYYKWHSGHPGGLKVIINN